MPPIKNLKVMLVEDDDSTRHLIEDILKFYKFRLHSFSHGGEAMVEITNNDDFDLAILDLRIPQATGLELACALRHKNPKIPIIVITGFAETVMAQKMKILGVDAILTKPFKAEELETAVNKAIAKHS